MKERDVEHEVLEVMKGYAIVKSSAYLVNADGITFGRKRIYYDVVAEEGCGDIVESFKSVNEARKYLREK